MLNSSRGRAAPSIPFVFAGAVSALITSGWFLQNQVANGAWGNPWAVFNLPDAPCWRCFALARVEIFAAALSILCIVLTRLRLASALALSALLVALWFACSVTPYRIPVPVHLGRSADLQILHIEKRGMDVHETQIAVFKDGKFVAVRTSRRILNYRFWSEPSLGVAPVGLLKQAMHLARDPTTTGLAKPLRTWKADGWYLLSAGWLSVFTSESRSEPPQEVRDLFQEIERLPVFDRFPAEARRDICLGLCYDPAAALGFAYPNHQCRTSEDGRTRCQ